MSRFPKKWDKHVWRAVCEGPTKDLERKRCEEWLKMLKWSNRVLIEHPLPWPSRNTWIENALDRHRERPFYAILVEEGAEANPKMVAWEEVYSEHPLLRVETGITIERDPEVMAECVASLLRVAREVVFVDRHFVPTNEKWTAPLGAFLGRVAQRLDLKSVRRLELHTAVHRDDPSAYRANCERELKRVVPPGLTLSVVLYGWSELHDRFVLTERGGFNFGHGLDASPTGQVHVNILSESQWREEWEKHQGRSPLCTIRA